MGTEVLACDMPPPPPPPLPPTPLSALFLKPRLLVCGKATVFNFTLFFVFGKVGNLVLNILIDRGIAIG